MIYLNFTHQTFQWPLKLYGWGHCYAVRDFFHWDKNVLSLDKSDQSQPLCIGLNRPLPVRRQVSLKACRQIPLTAQQSRQISSLRGWKIQAWSPFLLWMPHMSLSDHLCRSEPMLFAPLNSQLCIYLFFMKDSCTATSVLYYIGTELTFLVTWEKVAVLFFSINRTNVWASRVSNESC